MMISEAIGVLAQVPVAWGHCVLGVVSAERGEVRLHFVRPTPHAVMVKAREIVAYHLHIGLQVEVSCAGQT